MTNKKVDKKIISQIFIIVCIGLLWAVAALLIRLLPSPWCEVVPMGVGWCSCVVYNRIFKAV